MEERLVRARQKVSEMVVSVTVRAPKQRYAIVGGHVHWYKNWRAIR